MYELTTLKYNRDGKKSHHRTQTLDEIPRNFVKINDSIKMLESLQSQQSEPQLSPVLLKSMKKNINESFIDTYGSDNMK